MQPEVETKGFIKDEPIEAWDEDLLRRGLMAESLVERLMNTKVDKEAFTLGIAASWGEGKTSFMDLMEKSLKKNYKDRVIIMNFNPWLYGKEVDLLHVFFGELRRKIAPWNGKLSRDLRHYADALSNIETPWRQVFSVLKVGFPFKNIKEQGEDIREQIKRLQKKIVIFVDDIDRLEGAEMAEVFQLVRNASNFPHMYFVVGYDKKYVVDTLQGVYGIHKLLYTEKILQEEYVLPKMTEQDIFESLKVLFEKVLNEKDYEQLQVLSWGPLQEINICKYFKNLRDIKRFGNILIGYYARLKDEVNIDDFVRYLILHFRYPLVQSFIEAYRKSVLRQADGHWQMGKIELYRNPTTEKEKVVDIFDRQDHFDLIECLQQDDYKEKWHLDIMDVPLVIRLLEGLWGSNRNLVTMGINNPKYIHRYFLKNLLEEEIPRKEMAAFLRLDFQSMKPKIQEWAESKSASLVTQLSLVPKDNKELVKKYLQVIFYVNEIGTKNRFHFLVIHPMIRALYNAQTDTYNEEDKRFIRELLLREENPCCAVPYISSIEEDENNWFPLDKEELKEIKNTIFQKYANDPRNGIEAICDMWCNTRTQLRVTENGPMINHYDKRCNQTMRNIAESNFENFIPLSIQKEGGTPQLFSLSLPAVALWESKEGYFDYAESQKKNTPKWNKYSDFLHRLKA
ncbi:MAG: KAP family NTPase, partial [Bacteroides sp.]|nr:KAP family NTPase [Bacteroides sp.]